ncbi:MAG: hypothetical protein AB1746_10740, partial [Candidatus Zixiibacteriota bacterium]
NDKVTFEYRKQLKTRNESDAREYDNLVEAEIKKTPASLRLFLRAPNPAPWSGEDNTVSIEGELSLPADCQIEIDAEYFDLIIEGPFTSVENRSSFGRMDISNITRSLIVAGSTQNINLNNISGEITVSVSNADLTAERLVTKDEMARIKNENGDVTVSDIEGSFTIRNSYGKVKIDRAELSGGGCRIIGTHCPIRVEIVGSESAGLAITNDFEDVSIQIAENVPARFMLNVDTNGEMHVTDLPVKPVIVQSNRLECYTGEGLIPIAIDVEDSGNIFVEGIQVDR